MSDVSPEFKILPDDLRAIIRHPDPDRRVAAAQRVSRAVRDSRLTERDRERAHTVLRHIAADTAAMVRRALAITLKNSPELPEDVAVKLIHDIDNIAVPILELPPVLTDLDLLSVLRSRGAAKIMAIARRTGVSGSIARATIRFGDSRAVANIAANDRAPLGEAAYKEILEPSAGSDFISESLIKRRDLPPAVIERLLSFGSEAVALRLIDRHNISADLTVILAGRSHERAAAELASQDWSSRGLSDLTRAMHDAGRLTASMIIRAAACGQMRFVELALATRANVSHAKAALMLYEPGDIGLTVLTRAAKIGEPDMYILRGAITVYRELETGGLDYDRAYFQRLLIQRVLTLPVEFTEAQGDYLLEKLDGHGSSEFD